MVSKKAHLGNSFDGGYTWGSDRTQRYTLDGNYQFSDTVAGRLNLMSHESPGGQRFGPRPHVRSRSV